MPKRRKALTGLKPRASRGKSLERGGLGPGGDPNILSSGTITLPAGSIPSVSDGKSSAVDFAHALMRGDPIATKAAEQAMNSPERFVNIVGEEPTLADQFIASTYTMAKRLNLKAASLRTFEPLMAQYRNDMRHAHRFVLDNDFTRYATEVSTNCTAPKLLTYLQYATLPYDKTWIEFDLWAKLRVMRAAKGLDPEGFEKEGTSRRMGMLIHRINETDALVEIVNSWGAVGPGDTVGPNLLAYLFSTREREWGDQRYFGCMPMSALKAKGFRPDMMAMAARDTGISPEEQQRLAEMSANISGGTMWGFHIGGSAMMIEDIEQLKHVKTPEFLRRHGDAAFGRMYYVMEEALKRSGYKAEPLDHTLKIELAEFTGTVRWVVIVLAMLNETPVRADHVQPSHQMKAGLTRRIRAMDYHRLTLRLPKVKPVPYIERKISGVEHHRKAHEVRAHWRTYLPDVHCSRDDHAWEYDSEHGYALCGKCMAFRRRIPEHVRGDPNLGWVRKDYVIKPSKQT